MAAPNIFESASYPTRSQQSSRANATTENVHRKIELQAPADLTYLIANVTRAAREKIDKHFPPDAANEAEGQSKAGSEDVDMRKRVEELVDEYIRDTFSAAKDSLAINGLDSQELEAELAKIQEGEELEPFDAKLATRIQSLAAQIEAQTLEMASLRRKAPQQTAKRFAATFERESADHEARLQAASEAQIAAAQATRIAVDTPEQDAERREDIQDAYRQGVDDLVQLKAGMGGTVAKMERAQQAVQVVDER